jgi:hypothetical protein
MGNNNRPPVEYIRNYYSYDGLSALQKHFIDVQTLLSRLF